MSSCIKSIQFKNYYTLAQDATVWVFSIFVSLAQLVFKIFADDPVKDYSYKKYIQTESTWIKDSVSENEANSMLKYIEQHLPESLQNIFLTEENVNIWKESIAREYYRVFYKVAASKNRWAAILSIIFYTLTIF